MTQTITAMYDTYTDATAAKAQLIAIGIPEVGVRILSGSEAGTTTSAATTHEGGMWGSLPDRIRTPTSGMPMAISLAFAAVASV
ncbi:hypothetical protein MKK88_13415 [Methylobacterium sp. E-005]|uniref:hypothetical protein n=1 Tax=Methylobacterium sp. E-005 TaxID=2836549 RepID=UPI001FBADCAA|nr:hypothetical protein [Methylobacterium sp. E-005]MCJ2086981.1 hypothetical protein [Methylobacterium sp. E-005]